MIRGTTAQFQFKLPYSKKDVQIAEVTWWQTGNTKGLNEGYPLPMKKGYTLQQSEDGEIITSGPWNWVDDYTLSVKLWQQETLTFSDKYKAHMQLRAKTVDGFAFASDDELIPVYPIYGDHPLGDEVIPAPSENDLIIFDGDEII